MNIKDPQPLSLAEPTKENPRPLTPNQVLTIMVGEFTLPPPCIMLQHIMQLFNSLNRLQSVEKRRKTSKSVEKRQFVEKTFLLLHYHIYKKNTSI